MVTKKKAASKKSSPETKKTAPRATAQKTKKPVAKKSIPVVSAAAVQAIAPTPKKTPAKQASPKTKETPPQFTKDLIPEVPPIARVTPVDTSLFTTILALFVVALVVLWGYIYSRQARIANTPPVSAISPVVSEPQRISIASSVALTPEVIEALENIVTKVTIGPDEVLQSVRSISDTAGAKSESSDFFADVASWDLVFQFRTMTILYRPSTEQIIKTGILPPPPRAA